MPSDLSFPNNHLLASLPTEDYERIKPYLEEVTLNVGDILYHEGEPIQHLYFPCQALVSLISTTEDGSTMEIGLIGQEGVVGCPAFLGGQQTTNCAVVQIADQAMKIPVAIVQQEFDRGKELQKRLLLYTQALLTQVSQTAVCNRHHTVDQRLARWLLSVQDHINKDKFYLTHEYIASMLGIRRAGVTVAAGSLQKMGMIHYRRGWITISDRPKLETMACECYGIVQREYHRLLGVESYRENQ